MSHYVMNYHDAWADLRKGVKAARADYLRKMERLGPYADSAQGRKDIEAAKSDYQAALEAARATARPKFARAIEGMRERIAAPDMTAPTQDMLSILTMLNMRDEIDTGEIEAAARAMGNNDAALRTLRDILTRKGRVMPSSVKTHEAQTRDAVDALQSAASNLLSWDGRTSQEISNDASKARNDWKWGGGGPMTGHERDSQTVADIEAASFYKDTARHIIGGDVGAGVIDALE